MSRETGPRVKWMRALGVDLPGLSPKTAERRPYPPGQHGQRRRKDSEFAKRLREKQKLRRNYGIQERQMRRLFHEAQRSRQNAGTKLLELLERRLDNVVFRAGFARSIPAARQLVNHGHVRVDGRRVDIASFRVKVGQVVAVAASARDYTPVTEGLALAATRRWETAWLTVDPEQRAATVKSLPDEGSVPFPIDVQLVVELYALKS